MDRLPYDKLWARLFRHIFDPEPSHDAKDFERQRPPEGYSSGGQRHHQSSILWDGGYGALAICGFASTDAVVSTNTDAAVGI